MSNATKRRVASMSQHTIIAKCLSINSRTSWCIEPWNALVFSLVCHSQAARTIGHADSRNDSLGMQDRSTQYRSLDECPRRSLFALVLYKLRPTTQQHLCVWLLHSNVRGHLVEVGFVSTEHKLKLVIAGGFDRFRVTLEFQLLQP